jgi:hypothetical protein
MKTRMSLIGATLATLFAANALASTHATDAVVSMTIEDAAPIRATLLPTVTLEATPATSESNPATMRIADTEPLEVVLLPTVHVTARQPALATTLLPTVRVTPASTAVLESMEIADNDGASGDLPVIDDESPPNALEQPLGLRARAMPR